MLTPDYCEDVWLLGYGMPTDLNQDCYVNWQDFLLFAGDWLRCNDPTDLNCETTW